MKERIIVIAITFVATLVFGIMITLSFLRTNFTNYQVGLSDLWSIASTVIGVALAGVSIWQYLMAEGEKKRTKSQVKIWMQDAKGIASALNKIQTATHSGISDVCNSIAMVEAFASSMYQSLYEERVVDEEDYKDIEKKKTDIIATQEIERLSLQGIDIQNLKDKASTLGSNTLQGTSKSKSSR